MIDAVTQPFIEFAFMRRALVGCLALSLGAPPIGVFLMLRRMSLMGDAMSHAILPGAAIGFLVAGLSLPAMSMGGFVAGFAVALASGLVARATILREDASLAAFYLVSLALGVLIVSVRGSNIDLLHVLFGSVLALDDAALMLVAGITTVTLTVLAAIYRPLVLECFDPQFLRSASSLSSPTHFTFLVLVVLNLVGMFPGYASFGWVADQIGRRKAFLSYCLIAALLIPLYAAARSQFVLLILGTLVAFFGTGIFSGSGIMGSEIFPTAVRARALGFTYNGARTLSSLAPLVIGRVGQLKGLSWAFYLCAAGYFLAALMTTQLPETKGKTLD